MSLKEEFLDDKIVDEKAFVDQLDLQEENDVENSKIEAVRLVIPLTDDPTMPVVTFRFWTLSFLFAVMGSIIQQYYYFRSTTGSFSIYFVNLATYAMGKGMARILPTSSFSIGGYSISLNPGPFNIKEHAAIGIAVGTAAQSAYAIDILAAMDLYLHHRIGALGGLLLLFTTQCIGYGMAGMLRRFLIYPAEMVWWSTLVQIVFFNAMHNTDEFKNKKMIRGWSYMKYFWVFCGGMFIWEFLPQWLAPMLGYFDWICWIKPFNYDFWAISSSITGGGALSLSFDWTAIGGATLWTPLATQLCSYGGTILSYWIILPSLWLTNTLRAKTYGHPLTSHLFYDDGTRFNVTPFLEADFTLNTTMYDQGPSVQMTPMYALNFFWSFVSLSGCIAHIWCFHGKDIMNSWRSLAGSAEEDIHTKLMRAYPEVPQWWYAVLYVLMFALSIVTCEVYGLQLPWWALIVALAIGWLLSFPSCALYAITNSTIGLNVITELICGYMLPGKPIANMVFKCYGYMAMSQSMSLLEDLKLGHYMKIPPRALFVAQMWGTIVGAVFNYFTMIVIVNAHRSWLDGTGQDPSDLWTGYNPDVYWGSALIFGAVGPRRMFAAHGPYGWIFFGFILGAAIPVILWGLGKKFPNVQWSKFNIAIIAGGMSAYPNGYVTGVLPALILCVIFQFYIFRYHKNWWKKYTFILSAALDTGAAFTGLLIFFFLGGGVSPKLDVKLPSWWANYYNATDDSNAPYLDIDRCGDSSGVWSQGGYEAILS
ncbi:hypothetical protein BGZ83_008758 [Gryganskiella cystojenkinii]|nr:hypothetical protein BGZ83_008758 [Gryganskiella cystojenkinii]